MRVFPRRNVEISLKEISIICKGIFLRDKTSCGQISAFEKEFAHYIGVKHTVVVPSARIGLSILLDSLGYHKGDEVILAAYNYHVIPALIKLKGLKPVFVDIDPYAWNINTSSIEKCITPKTRFLIATHLFGQACDMKKIIHICRKNNITLIEDVAHSCGAEYRGTKLGSLGDAAYFSFGTGKALVAFGGGMLTTNDFSLFEKIQRRLHNLNISKNSFNFVSFLKTFAEVILTNRICFSILMYPIIFFMNIINSDLIDRLIEDKYVLEDGKLGEEFPRFSESQAAVALVQLGRLEDLNEKRIDNARLMTELLKNIPKIEIPFFEKDNKNIALYYCISTEGAKELRKYLALRGVDTKRGSMKACSSLNFFDRTNICPVAERIANNVIELPCYPSLTDKDIYYQAGLIRKFYGYI